MLTEIIQAELVRLELHPVNLSVSGHEGSRMILQGSLLRCWNLPPRLDGQWLLAQLRGMPDAAGPKSVMSGLVEAYENENAVRNSGDKAQLRLFDAQASATSPASFATGEKPPDSSFGH